MPYHSAHTRTIDYSKRLAQRLEELRHQAGLTQAEVASRAGINPKTYQKYESGFSRNDKHKRTPANPQYLTLVSLADAFEISVSDLLDFDIDYDALGAHADQGRP